MIRINGLNQPSTANDSTTPGAPYGTYEMLNHPELYEPQRTNNFEFIVTNIDNIRRSGFTDDDTSRNATIPNAQEVIRMAVRGTFLPSFSQNPVTIRRGNTSINYAGTPNFSGGTIRLYDYIGLQVLDTLQAWQNKSYNVRTEKVGLAEDYKKTCYVIEYTPDYQVVRRWKLYGCWISGLTYDDLSSDDSNAVTCTATITYDKFEPDTSSIV